MTLKGWLLSTLLVGGVVYGLRGGCANSTEPDEELADHFTELCTIAKKNIETPVKGVTKLGRYMARHTGDILGDFGETIIAIEKIGDDGKHDERARLARDRMQRPWIDCAGDWQAFWTAVDNDPEASAIATRAADRLGRTLEIIFSSTQLRLRDLPAALLRRIDDGR